jgi:hypothetical protein
MSFKFVRTLDSNVDLHYSKEKKLEDIERLLPIPREKYNVTIKILGLRGLKSKGLLPIKRPIIKFDLNSLRYLDEK